MRLCCSCAMVKLLAVLFIGQSAHAGLTTYTDRGAWFGDVSGAGAAITSIGFDELGGLAIVTDQYQHLGVTFTDGNDSTRGEDFIVFPRDGWGLDGNPDIAMEFDGLRNAIAVDYPGDVTFDLYQGDEHVGSHDFIAGGFGNFGGLISSIFFDRVHLTDPVVGNATIDDLHFAFIPAPAGLLILLPWTVLRSRIRRRGASI